MDVYMYPDDPGNYLNAFGAPVPEEIAKGAGFPVDVLKAEKTKRERIAHALDVINREIEGITQERKVVEEVGGFKILDVGLGRHVVEDPDGNMLTPQPLPLEAAQVLVGQMAPKAEGASEKASGGKKAPKE
jgi:hypothetical protein